MAVRAAGPEDFEEAVARVRSVPMPAVTAWALQPAPDLIEAHVAYSRCSSLGSCGSDAFGSVTTAPWQVDDAYTSDSPIGYDSRTPNTAN